MRDPLRYLSTFSGVGGFDEAFRRVGAQCEGVVEIDPACQSVLRAKFPGVRIYNDVREVGIKTHERGTIDALVGGFPCQDVSVAGKRAGLAGERSGLFYEFARIADELEPYWVEIENVPGLLNSHDGKDFAIIIGWLTGVVPKVPRDGWKSAGFAWGRPERYRVAWRVLDSQFFHLAQRRQRVFIIGSLGDGRCAEVLFESESLPGNPAKSRKEGKRIAAPVTSSSPSRRNGGSRPTDGTFVYGMNPRKTSMDVKEGLSPTIHTGDGGMGGPAVFDGRNLEDGDISPTLQAKESGGYSLNFNPVVFDARGNGDGETTNAIVGDHGNRVTDWTPILVEGMDDTIGAIQARDSKGIGTTIDDKIIAFQQNLRDEVRLFNDDGLITGAVQAQPGTKQQTYVAGLNDPEISNMSWTIRQGKEGGGKGFLAKKDLAMNLGGQQQFVGVRRLTPRETERLQGFDDDWTELGMNEDGKQIKQSDTARYRQMGNAVSVPPVYWIAKRMVNISKEGEK